MYVYVYVCMCVKRACTCEVPPGWQRDAGTPNGFCGEDGPAEGACGSLPDLGMMGVRARVHAGCTWVGAYECMRACIYTCMCATGRTVAPRQKKSAWRRVVAEGESRAPPSTWVKGLGSSSQSARRRRKHKLRPHLQLKALGLLVGRAIRYGAPT